MSEWTSLLTTTAKRQTDRQRLRTNKAKSDSLVGIDDEETRLSDRSISDNDRLDRLCGGVHFRVCGFFSHTHTGL